MGMNVQRKTDIGALLDLCKWKVSAPVTLSAVAGYVFSSSGIRAGLIAVTAGVFLLSAGCSALNQCQEGDIDARMDRTSRRPIPSGKTSVASALRLSVVLISVGLMLILFSGGPFAAYLGLGGVVAYNGMYTFLKKRSAFAVVPGALIGTIPPIIGWVSAGGSIFSFRLAVLCFFFFMWQIPHFWLLLLRYGAEYESAGLPSLGGVFSRDQSRRIVFHWMIAAAVSCQLISLFGVKSHLVGACLLVVALFCVVSAFSLLKRGALPLQSAFGRLNSYMFVVLFLVMFDGIAALLEAQLPNVLTRI
jgi:protoheme IX farnesyltransferase